jgi:ABC-type transporter Mla maintaining outer membrane lipid asymmetry ATPase subunit MlaF
VAHRATKVDGGLVVPDSVILVGRSNMTVPVLELTAVSKSYGALRPLRLEQLTLSAGEQVAILGLDQPAAEVLINLLTGASLPDTGHVHIGGRLTSEIADSADWLATIDRFGIVSERAALLEPMTVIQNLAVPFSLEIEPPPPGIVQQASALAREAGLDASTLDQRVGDLDPASRMRVRLGRALAFNPTVLILEHPSATLPRPDVIRFACDVRALAERRGIAALTITADPEFAGAVSQRALALEPSTGRLKRL